jgi:hypothetical protein
LQIIDDPPFDDDSPVDDTSLEDIPIDVPAPKPSKNPLFSFSTPRFRMIRWKDMVKKKVCFIKPVLKFHFFIIHIHSYPLFYIRSHLSRTLHYELHSLT